MNSPAPFPVHRIDQTPRPVPADCAQHAVAQLHGAAAEPAAQNCQPDLKLGIDSTEVDEFRSPLWPIAIGTAFLFGAMAAVIGFG